MWPPRSHLLIRPLRADKHLLTSLFDNINPLTDGCHLTGVFSCLAFVADNYTHADNMWTHFQCLSVASVPVTIPPLPFSPPFTSHFQCIQHLTGPDSQQCREAFRGPIKSLFSPLHLWKRVYHWGPSLYPVLVTSFHILPAWPPLAHYIFLLLFISWTDPSIYKGQASAVNAIFFIMVQFISSKFIFKRKKSDYFKKKSISYLYSLIIYCVISAAFLSRMDELSGGV